MKDANMPTIEVTRRSFLRGALAISVVPLLPSLAFVPTIYGDGVRDDAPGLQALIDGKPFNVEGEGFTALEGWISGGNFRLERGLIIRKNTSNKPHIKIINTRFQCDFADPDE